MSRICEVCGKERGFFTNEMVKGLSGQEVCKECLKKANISSARFGLERIYASEIRDRIENNTPIRRKFPSGCLPSIIIIVFFILLFSFIGLGSDTELGTTTDTINNESVAPFESDLVFEDAYIEESMFGTNELHITVKNKSSQTIDAFDYKIQAYNTYGEKVSNYLIDEYTATDIQIKANDSYSSSTSLILMDTATSFKIAITRYHIKDTNETVAINNSDRVWVSIKK